MRTIGRNEEEGKKVAVVRVQLPVDHVSRRALWLSNLAAYGGFAIHGDYIVLYYSPSSFPIKLQLAYSPPPAQAAFFISLNLPITPTGSVFPVAFLHSVSLPSLCRERKSTHCASGVSSRIKTFHFFSSPMVDLPVVQLSFCAFSISLHSSASIIRQAKRQIYPLRA